VNQVVVHCAGVRTAPAGERIENNWALLGGLRFCLALVVALTHLGMFAPAVTASSNLLVEAFTRYAAMGAVFGFFLISGYSVAASYERNPSDFYFRRALRIMPLYVLINVFAAVLPFFFNDRISYLYGIFEMPSYGELALNLCMFQGLFCEPLRNNGVVWSLSVEVCLYLFTPWFARLSDSGLRRLMFGSVAFYVVLAFVTERGGGLYNLYGVNVGSLAWLYLLGMLLRRDHGNFTLAIVVGGVVAPLHIKMFFGPSFPILWLICVAAIAYGHKLKLPPLVQSVLHFLGEASYPLYLVHIPLFALFVALRLPRGLWFLPAVVCVAFALDCVYDRSVKRFVSWLVGSRCLLAADTIAPRTQRVESRHGG
jgi:peptidoglycan/LPS O-acetylase OafA/YrhL